MPKIFVNYVERNGKIELLDEGCVYTDVPICIKDKFIDIVEPYLVRNESGFMVCIEKSEYFKANKEYKLRVTEDNKLVEDENGEVTCIMPRGINLDNLRYDKGEIKEILPNKPIKKTKKEKGSD